MEQNLIIRSQITNNGSEMDIIQSYSIANSLEVDRW